MSTEHIRAVGLVSLVSLVGLVGDYADAEVSFDLTYQPYPTDSPSLDPTDQTRPDPDPRDVALAHTLDVAVAGDHADDTSAFLDESHDLADRASATGAT